MLFLKAKSRKHYFCENKSEKVVNTLIYLQFMTVRIFLRSRIVSLYNATLLERVLHLNCHFIGNKEVAIILAYGCVIKQGQQFPY